MLAMMEIMIIFQHLQELWELKPGLARKAEVHIKDLEEEIQFMIEDQAGASI